MAAWLIPLLKAVAPALIGAGVSKVASKKPTAGFAPSGAGAGVSSELERAALDRVRQSNPLYEMVMKMAAGRMPLAYQSGGGAGVAPGAAAGAARPAAPIAVPDFAQEIVDEYRRRSMGGNSERVLSRGV